MAFQFYSTCIYKVREAYGCKKFFNDPAVWVSMSELWNLKFNKMIFFLIPSSSWNLSVYVFH